MKLVIDLGDSARPTEDIKRLLGMLDQPALELTDNRWHIGVRLVGVLHEADPWEPLCDPGHYYVEPL